MEGVGGSGETARSPFPKCFLAPTRPRRACGALGGARGQIASAPCCLPRVACPRPAPRPASSQCSGGTEVPKAGGASEYSKIKDFNRPVSPAAASVSSTKGKEVRGKLAWIPISV